MKKFTLYFFAFLCMFITSCGDSDDDPVNDKPSGGGTENPDVPGNICNVNVRFILPEEFSKGTLQDITLNVKDINTGKKYEFKKESPSDTLNIRLKLGLYEIAAEGSLLCKVNGDDLKYDVNGLIQSVEVTRRQQETELSLFIQYGKPGFVFAELFFTGTMTPQGSQYFADKYFVIYNNSDETLYADSLAIAESKFLTVTKENYSPDIMDEAMAVQALYMIPGNGMSHPVKPGGSILICDNALNHKRANEHSFDLTHADFEWADESTNPNISDVNNPDVPDLDKIYCSTKTIWSPHNRGFCSYALVKMGTDKQDYLSNYKYDYDYTMVLPAGEFPMTGSCYKVPNKWIVDAVNLSVEALFKWIVVHPSLDRGWTYCGKIDHDDSRYGKSVRRKVESRRADGTARLQDTNNSSSDFEAEQTADPYHKF